MSDEQDKKISHYLKLASCGSVPSLDRAWRFQWRARLGGRA